MCVFGCVCLFEKKMFYMFYKHLALYIFYQSKQEILHRYKMCVRMWKKSDRGLDQVFWCECISAVEPHIIR